MLSNNETADQATNTTVQERGFLGFFWLCFVLGGWGACSVSTDDFLMD